MSENDMVAKIEDALYGAGFEHEGGVSARILARAALEAIRVPSRAMVEAGQKVVEDQFDHWDPGMFHGCDDAWRAMIDKALGGK